MLAHVLQENLSRALSSFYACWYFGGLATAIEQWLVDFVFVSILSCSIENTGFHVCLEQLASSGKTGNY